MRRTRSALSLFDPMVSDRRAEFRYSTFAGKKPHRDFPLPATISKMYRKKNGNTLHPIGPVTRAKKKSTIVASNTHLFKRLAKDYILPERRLSSFRRKSWKLTPPEPNLNNLQMEHAKKQAEYAICETKYMINAMLAIIEDYDIENNSSPYNSVNVASSRRYNYKTSNQAPPFEIPRDILSKYKDLKMPNNKCLLQKLLRPQIYFEVQRLGSPSFQRIFVELYTEACPQVVLEFVRRCSQNCYERFSFQRSFPELWIEAGLKLDSNTLNNCCIEYDMRALDHGSNCGILSFAGRYVEGFRKCMLDFSLSVNRLPEMNCTRVAFGVVTSGLDVLECMQLHDMKTGDGIQDYRVVCCGLVQR